MSLIGPSASGDSSHKKENLFDPDDYKYVHIIKPQKKHLATIVWLHALGDSGFGWTRWLPLIDTDHIKWVIPTAPLQKVKLLKDSESTAWFDVKDLSEDESLEELDAVTEYVAKLLRKESSHNIKLGVGGFSMGAAVSIYCAIRFASGKFGHGLKLSVVIALSGWLPCSKNIDGIAGPVSLPVLLCHDEEDPIVQIVHSEKCCDKLREVGFEKVTFVPYKGVGHFPFKPQEMFDFVGNWLKDKLEFGPVLKNYREILAKQFPKPLGY